MHTHSLTRARMHTHTHTHTHTSTRTRPHTGFVESGHILNRFDPNIGLSATYSNVQGNALVCLCTPTFTTHTHAHTHKHAHTHTHAHDNTQAISQTDGNLWIGGDGKVTVVG